MSAGHSQGGPMRTVLSTLPVLILLGGLVTHWTVSQASGRLIQLGEHLWPGYAAELRRQAEVSAEPEPSVPAEAAAPSNPSPTSAGDPLVDGILGDANAGDAATPPTGSDPLVDGILGDANAGDAAAPAASADPLVDDLLRDAGVDPSAPPPAPQAAPAPSLVVPAAPVALTGIQRAYIAVDRALSAFKDWGDDIYSELLLLLVAICGTTATASRGHIAPRAPHTRAADRFSQAVQLLANLLVCGSGWALHRAEVESGAEIQDPLASVGWAVGFGLMALFNLMNLARPLPDPQTAPAPLRERALAMLLGVPLYATMALLASTWFLLVESYPAGLAVYLQKLTEHAQLYVFVGLYVWTGMLLKQTRVAPLAFNLLRPWKLPPELLAAVTVTLASVPTAYSGASGIFVIACGSLIYQELRAAGARPHLALATTALSGSLGVVLRPCLLVVIVAALNPVTTDELYGAGKWVFLLTSGLYTAALLLLRQGSLRFASPSVAVPDMLGRMKALIPYALIAGAVLAFCTFALGAGLDEHTAPTVLPLVLLGMIAMEARPGLRSQQSAEGAAPAVGGEPSRLAAASHETAGHIGALLLLMSLSLTFGGAFERSELMSLVPEQLGSPFTAMAVLVAVLVTVGMMMDPYGAVIVVAATISKVAYANGISPTHFWMTVLVAFELGYLCPPIALNQLLTRQVVGAEEVDRVLSETTGGFWARNERILLPCSVMGTALLLVAFVPLFFYSTPPTP